MDHGMHPGSDQSASGAGPSAQPSLADLVAQALEHIEHHGPTALEALCREHPRQATALRARVEQLRAIGFIGAPAAPDRDAPLPERIGGFRILSRLGGGGMGVVFLAEQDGLQRQVALKLVRPDLLYFPGARERFAREVEAVARLAHPGIVPVYAGGEDNGIPYYAMERVRGASLEELLAALAGRDPSQLTGAELKRVVELLVRKRDGPRDASRSESTGSTAGGQLFAGTWTSACLRVARGVAQALQHAHERGVLHRDIKPSNIMLTPDGRVLLLDFGLATAEGSERLTGTGAQLGSLAWMSPEQLRGEHATLDGRTDVYSLGATLYELLTLRSPFTGGDAETTRQRILDGRLIPLRDLNAAVPRDAETVCQRAMDRDRERRYPGALAFADDLDNALELRPVHARRPGPALKLRRWAQRHPTASVGLVAGLMLFAGGPLAYAWQQRQAKLQITAAYDEADAQRQRAESNFARAQKAVDVLLTQVAEEDLLDVPDLEPVRRRLLESALSFYEEFLTERADDPAMKRLVARATDRCGYLLLELGRNAEVAQVYERQAALARELLAIEPDDDELLDLLGNAEAGRGFTLQELGRLDEAAAASAEGLRVRRERVRLHPDEWSALRDVDESLGQKSILQYAFGNTEAALAADREVVAWNETVLEQASTDEQELEGIASLVTALGNLATHLKQMGLLDEARVAIDRGIELSEPYLEQLATVPQQALGAANVRMIRMDSGDPAVNEARLRDAIAIVELALEHAPQHVVLRRMLASGYNNLGRQLQGEPGRREEARAALQHAIDAIRRLVSDFPDVPGLASNLAGSLVNLGALVRDDGDTDAARILFEEALLHATAALELVPDDPDARNALFNAAWYLGLTCLQMNDAESCAWAAGEIVRRLPDEAKPLRVAAGLLARAAAAGSPAEAAAWRARSLEALRMAIAAGWSDTADLDTAGELAGLRELPEFEDLRAAAEAGAISQP